MQSAAHSFHHPTMRRSFLTVRSLSTLATGINPNDLEAYLSQCNKNIQRLSELGRLNDARHLFDTMPHRDSVSYNSMMSTYIQHKNVHEARKIFDCASGFRNVRTWTILLSGYAKAGLVDEAIEVFEAMPERNVVSWNAMLNGYLKNGDLWNGRRLFDEMPERSVASWNSLITGYSKSGLMKEAWELFEMMRERDCVTWMVMISGFVEMFKYREGWSVFLMMMTNGGELSQGVFVAGFSTVTSLNNLVLVESLRSLGIKAGYEGDVVVGTAVLNAYVRSGSLDKAVKFFGWMPQRNEYSWSSVITALSQCRRLEDAIALYERKDEKNSAIKNTMIAAYLHNGRIDDALRIFGEMVKPDVVAWNSIVSGYLHNGMLKEAKGMFLRMPFRNAASWAAMIAGLVQNGFDKEGKHLFSLLHRCRMLPSHSGFTSALSACANSRDVDMGKQIHSLAIKTRCQHNLYVVNGLISMYSKCNEMGDALLILSVSKR